MQEATILCSVETVNLAESGAFTYNAQTISSHVTGEKPGPCSGTRWVSIGKREISLAVRLGSPEWKVRLRLPAIPFYFWPSFDLEVNQVGIAHGDHHCH